MGKNKQRVENIILCGEHSIIDGSLPTVVASNPNNLADCRLSDDTLNLGLFGGGLNYHTYYPEVKPDDFNVKGEDLIAPLFRLLSETVVHRTWSPTDFSMNGVLKASMPLLVGQTVNLDHETEVGNSIGSVSKVFWQESYKVGNYKIPSGINGVLLIDAKSNPRIARGLNMDPPSIHSNSVSVMIKWEKSHPDMSEDDFWSKLGTYDSKGEMVRKVVSEIISYRHTSLVHNGADSFAKMIKDGKIINPHIAHAMNMSYSSEDEYYEALEKGRKKGNTLYVLSYKGLIDNEDETFVSNNKINPNSNNSTNKNQNEMEELKEFLASLPKRGDGKEWTKENLTETINSSIDVSKKYDELSKEVENLKAKAEKYDELEKNKLESIRDKAIANYKLTLEASPEDYTDSMVELMKSTSDIKVLETLSDKFGKEAEEKNPLHCESCGSKNVSRKQSEKSDNEDNGNENTENLDDSDVIDKIRASKRK